MKIDQHKCFRLALYLGFEGDFGSDFQLMDFLLLLCLKRVLVTKWSEYLHIWQQLRQWDLGTMTYRDLWIVLKLLVDTDRNYKTQQQRRIKGLFKGVQ